MIAWRWDVQCDIMIVKDIYFIIYYEINVKEFGRTENERTFYSVSFQLSIRI